MKSSSKVSRLPTRCRWALTLWPPAAWPAAGLVLLLAGVVARAQLQPPLVSPTDTGASARPHTLLVTVVDAVQGRPIAGASVTAPFLVPARRGDPPRSITDEHGVAALRFSFSFPHLPNLIMSVSHSNFAAREVTWKAPPGRLLESLPTNYTVKLSAAITVGGFVRDQRGRGIPDAQIMLWGGGQPNQQSPAESSVAEYSTVSRREPGQVRTDQRGFWTQSNFPADLEGVWLHVVRPGGADAHFGTAQGANIAEGWGVMEIEALRATNAILTLPDGVSLRGIVVDESGQPVPGVRLKERRGASYQTYVFTNQPDGRFELTHRSAAQVLIVAESPRHAIKSTIIELDSAKPEANIVLSNARPMRLRLLGERGAPIAEADVRPVEWRNPKLILDWSGTTDDDGRVVWTNPPAERVMVMVSAPRVQPRTFRVSPREEEIIVRLGTDAEQSIQVRVKAVEDGSGQPIPGFFVLRNVQFSSNPVEWGKAGSEGIFEAKLGPKDFQQTHDQSFGLSVRADGYALWTSEELFMLPEGNLDLTVRLKKARPPAGVVLRPDGQPAANARVLLNTGENPVYSHTPGDFSSGQAAEQTRTGSDGSFRFAASGEQQWLLVSHASGFAALTLEDLAKSGKIPLQAWGRIEGILRSGGKPVARERISLRTPLSWMSLESYRFSYNALTDQAGRFVFTNIPPGEHLLSRMQRVSGASSESHRMVVAINPGETKRIDYTLNGRVVTGTVDVEHGVDWSLDPQLLVLKQPAPPREPEYPPFGGQPAYRRSRLAYSRSPAVQEYERKRQQFQLIFDADGNFRVDDVPPGTYQLRLRLSEPPPPSSSGSRPRSYYGDRQQLGALVKEVTVPPGEPGTEVDLGNFAMTVKLPPTQRTPPLSFKAATLDGQPFDLAGLRGQSALVLFWANWAPQSEARLADLRNAVAKLASRSNTAFVTINLDDDVASARRGVQGLEKGWKHAHLGGASRFEVAERLALDTLPLTLLLDSEGLVVAREISGKRLAAALDRLARSSAGK